jgi:hypothetical protein
MADRAGMSPEYLSTLLASVPAYTTADFIMARGDKVSGMARDLPRNDGEPRRWTVAGWEWFIEPDTFRRIEIVNVENITLPTIELIG